MLTASSWVPPLLRMYRRLWVELPPAQKRKIPEQTVKTKKKKDKATLMKKVESRKLQRARIFDGVRKILNRSRPRPQTDSSEFAPYLRTVRGSVLHLRRDVGSAWCGKVHDSECTDWTTCPSDLPPCKPCRRKVGR